MNTTNKPALAETLWETTETPKPTLPTKNVIYLFEKGDLISKLQWKKGETVPQIYQHYVNYVHGNYGDNAGVALDGYPDETTSKDTTHLKHTKEKKGRLIKFALNSKMSMSQEKFLLHKVNKQEFI